MRRPLLAALAALSMTAAGTPALAQSAAPLSVAAHVRAGAGLQESNDIRGGFIIPTLAVIAIIALIYVLTKNDDPQSP